MSTTQHPLTDEQYERLANRHIDPRCLADEAHSMGYESARAAAVQGRTAEVTTEAIRREVEYAVRTAAAHGYAKGKWGADRSESIEVLIESASAALSVALAVATPTDPHHDPRPWQDCTREDIREGDLVETLCNDLMFVGVAHHQDEEGDWWTEGGRLLTVGDRWPLRRIPAHTTEKETLMPQTTPAEPLARTLLGVPAGHGAPHHDGVQIKAGDFLVEVDGDGLAVAGIAHHQDSDGDWRTKNGRAITWAKKRAARPDAITVWPAPTPPAVEVEMPDEFGDVILNPRWSRRSYTRAVHLGEGVWAAEITPGAQMYTHLVRDLRSATLPDGTRVRRDGERPDGEPRFVKVQEEEK